MKKYVFFTFAIFGIGGTQIYVRNKILYMQKLGWETVVVSTEPGEKVLVKELCPYTKGVFPQLLKNPYLYTKQERNFILNELSSYIGNSADEIVIESNFMGITPWGELLAERLKAQHFIFLIQENYSIKSRKYLEFFEFKYKRGELAVNTRCALKQLFEGYREISNDKTCDLAAVCSNVVEDCESNIESNLENADFYIGSIGRINKPFVLPMVEEISRYAKKHSDHTFQLVLFGGSPEVEDINRILEKEKESDNLYIYITGPIFPIPRQVIKKMDVFIASAGAAKTSSDEGCLTIAIDANDFQAMGILGCTTNDIIHRSFKDINYTTEQLLDQILYEKKYFNVHPKVDIESSDYMIAFEKHELYRSSATKDKSYYPVKIMAPKVITRFLYRLLGGNSATQILKYLKSK